MSNKTPYEVRLEILKMAQDIEMQRYYSDQSNIVNQWNVDVETARFKKMAPPEMPTMPNFPTGELIIQKAQLLGEFVNKNGN
jgi:hypothetical protein